MEPALQPAALRKAQAAAAAPEPPETVIDGVRRAVVPPEAWRAARDALLVEEKALTRAQDRLAAASRRAPWTPVTKAYAFEGPQGRLSLHDLFEGRPQLIVYHHMLRPADPAPCPGCGLVGDQIPHLAHLHARNTSLVFVSRAPVAEIAAFRARMGWAMPWVSTADSFNADHDVAAGFGLNVFYRSGDAIWRTWHVTGRGIETLGTVFTLLDVTPLGRQEDWEDAPAGSPQTPTYGWQRLHDEYGA